MARDRGSRIELNNFTGMFTSADPFDLPDGAAVNVVNMVLIDDGALTVRQGYQPVTFEEVE